MGRVVLSGRRPAKQQGGNHDSRADAGAAEAGSNRLRCRGGQHKSANADEAPRTLARTLRGCFSIGDGSCGADGFALTTGQARELIDLRLPWSSRMAQTGQTAAQWPQPVHFAGVTDTRRRPNFAPSKFDSASSAPTGHSMLQYALPPQARNPSPTTNPARSSR